MYKGNFNMFAGDKPKSKVVGDFHMDALMAQAQADNAAAAAAAANYPTFKTSKEVKMKDSSLPPALIMPFAGVAAAPSGQHVSPGSCQVSSTISTTSSKSSLSSASTASRKSRGAAVQPSGSWGNTGPYTHPPEREEKQTTPPPTKAPPADGTAIAAPTPDKDGWIDVVNKKSRHNATAASQNTSAPVVDVDEAPKMSRRQKKQAAAALAAAWAVPDISPPTPSPIASTAVTETVPKQENECSTVASKKPSKKAPADKYSYIWDESKSTLPDTKATGRSNNNKSPIAQADVHYPALEVPKIKVSPMENSSKTLPPTVQPPEPVAILKTTKDDMPSQPTKEPSTPEVTPAVPEVKNNFTQLTGEEYNVAMPDWSGQLGTHMSRLFSMVVMDSFVKSTPEPVVLETAPTPFIASPAAVVDSPAPVIVLPAPTVSFLTPVITAPKKKKLGAQHKKAKKAKAAAEALAAEVAMAEPAAPIQQTAVVQVSQVDSFVDGKDISSSVPEIVQDSTASDQTVAVDVTEIAPAAIEENSSAGNISSVVPETTRELTVSEQVLEEPLIAATEDEDLNEAVVQVPTVSLKSLADIAMMVDRFCLQFGFDDVFEDPEPLTEMKMTDDRFSLQHGLEDLIKEASATDLTDPYVPITKPKIQIAFPELDADVLRLCDIVHAEIFSTDAQDIEEIEANEPSPPVAESITDAITNVTTTLIDIRINQLYMGGISISEILERVAREDTTDATYSKEQIATAFISCADRERKIVGMRPSMGSSKANKVLQSPILQNIVRVRRTKLADFLALLYFEDGRMTLPGVAQVCIVSAEK